MMPHHKLGGGRASGQNVTETRLAIHPLFEPFNDLRYLESVANAATFTTTMASAAKNSFAGAVAQGGAGPEDYLPHLTDFIARANGVE